MNRKALNNNCRFVAKNMLEVEISSDQLTLLSLPLVCFVG